MNDDNGDSGVTVESVKAALTQGLHGILKAAFDEALDLDVEGNTFNITAKDNGDLTAKITIQETDAAVKLQYVDERTSADYVVQKNGMNGALPLTTNRVCEHVAAFGARAHLLCNLSS